LGAVYGIAFGTTSIHSLSSSCISHEIAFVLGIMQVDGRALLGVCEAYGSCGLSPSLKLVVCVVSTLEMG